MRYSVTERLLLRVPKSSSMDDDTFVKHLNARHIPCGDFSDLRSIRPGSGFSADRHVFETYHKHLHERYDYEHEHGPSSAKRRS